MTSKLTTKTSDWTVDRLLRVHTRLDVIVNVDLINDRIDVRSCMVMAMSPNEIVVTQTEPPVLKSMIGQAIEATFVTRDPVSSEVSRWGWHGQIVDIVKNFKIHESDPESHEVFILSLPPGGLLTETNARMDYRLSASSEEKVSIQTHPSFGRITLMDFSAGGVLIGVPAPPQASIRMRLWFTLYFPGQGGREGQATINGEAEVVRIMYEPGDPKARIGLKFIDLDLSATRALQKAINFYMLEEQRLRNRQG